MLFSFQVIDFHFHNQKTIYYQPFHTLNIYLQFSLHCVFISLLLFSSFFLNPEAPVEPFLKVNVLVLRKISSQCDNQKIVLTLGV